MAKPASVPTWATDGGTTLEPSAGEKAAGWTASDKPPARWFNWWMNLVYEWIAYLNGITTDAQFLASLFAWTGTHTFTPSTATTNGITATGNTTGVGVRAYGGSTGAGVSATGGASGGNGGNFSAQFSGAYGVQASGVGAGHGCVGFGGATGAGGLGTGGATSGAGVLGLGNGAALPTMAKEGVYGVGVGVSPGVRGAGGATGPGVQGTGGSTSGAGGSFTGGPNSDGAYCVGAGTGHGVEGLAPSTGNGGRFTSNGASGIGAYGEGTGAGGFGGYFKGGTASTAAGIGVQSSDSDAPHIRMYTGVSAAPTGRADGCIWFASGGSDPGLYFQADGHVYSFRAAGLYRDGVLIA